MAKDETQVWNLEKAYWEYVKANDVEKYRALWRDDFFLTKQVGLVGHCLQPPVACPWMHEATGIVQSVRD